MRRSMSRRWSRRANDLGSAAAAALPLPLAAGAAAAAGAVAAAAADVLAILYKGGLVDEPGRGDRKLQSCDGVCSRVATTLLCVAKVARSARSSRSNTREYNGCAKLRVREGMARRHGSDMKPASASASPSHAASLASALQLRQRPGVPDIWACGDSVES